MKRLAAIAFVFLAVLSPGFTVVPGMPVVRGEDVLLVLVFPILLLVPGLSGSRLPLRRGDQFSAALVWMMGVAVVSIVANAARTPTTLNDWMIVPMLFKYWLIYRFAQSLEQPRDRRLCLYAAAVSIGISALIGIAQYHNLAGINQWLSPFYYRGAQAQESLMNIVSEVEFARVGGTNGDPRHYGYILIIGLAVYASLFLYARQAFVRLFSVGLAGVAMVALIYTASRTPMLAGALVAVTATFLHRKTSPGRLRTYGLLAVLAVLSLAGFYMFATGVFKERIFDTHTASFQGSTWARQRDLQVPFLEAIKDPSIFVIGRGPAKSVLRTSGHSDVGWYFHRFGLIGLALYMFLLWKGLRQGYRLLLGSRSQEERALRLSGLLVVIIWSSFVFAENIFKNPQLMALNMFFIGMCCSRPRRQRWSKLPPAAQGGPGQAWRAAFGGQPGDQLEPLLHPRGVPLCPAPPMTTDH